MKARHVSIPLNQLSAVNNLKRSINKLIQSNELDMNSNDFNVVSQYCKADTKYCNVTFEYLMEKLNEAKNKSYFELLLFLFDKSKVIKQLMSPRIHQIFGKAFSLYSVREWAVDLLKKLDEKYGESIPAIRSEIKSLRFEQIKTVIDDHIVFVEENNEKEYRNTIKRIGDWKTRSEEYKIQWYKHMEEILPFYCSEKKRYDGDKLFDSWGIDIEVCQNAFEVWKKYGGTSNKRLLLDMKTLSDSVNSLRGTIWNGYISFVLVQKKMDQMNEEQLEEYYSCYHTITETIDTLDEIIIKAKELKLYL